MILLPKIEACHQRLQAIVYIRQSTPKQVQSNQESTRRQYQLAERARQMEWPASQIRVIDEDLGLSRASGRQRTGFQKMVAAIGLGKVGIILVTEVSRLNSVCKFADSGVRPRTAHAVSSPNVCGVP